MLPFFETPCRSMKNHVCLLWFGHTKALLKKNDAKQPFSPPFRNWPIWVSYTLIYPHIPSYSLICASYTLIYLHIPHIPIPIPSYTFIYPHTPSYTLIYPHMWLLCASYTLIYPPIPSYTLVYHPIPSYALVWASYTLIYADIHSYVPHIHSYTLIYPHVPSYTLIWASYTLIHPHIPSYGPHMPSYTLKVAKRYHLLPKSWYRDKMSPLEEYHRDKMSRLWIPTTTFKTDFKATKCLLTEKTSLYETVCSWTWKYTYAVQSLKLRPTLA